MSDNDENISKNRPDDEASLDEFLEPDNYNGDKIIIQKKPKRTINIVAHDNNSGMGEAAPYNVARKYNWGAFLFNWIWGIKYRRYSLILIPVLCFIKYGFLLAFLLAFFAGTQGNQWAWEEVQYKDEQDFHNAQKAWVKTWLILAAIAIVIAAPFAYIYKLPQKSDDNEIFDPISNISSLELSIPKEVYEQTTSDDNHSDILSSEKNVIYWVRPKNALTEKNLADIEQMYKASEKVKEKYVLYPDLKALQDNNVKVVKLELEASCINKTCIDEWLYKACNNGYCIINPKMRKYYKVREKSHIIPKALKIIRSWE